MENLFDKNNIQVIDQAKDWKNAVKIASQPLLVNKTISNLYIENMIKSVQDNGPYMVLTDYFALMHAKPGIGVNKVGMSLLIVKHPVNLAGKLVKVFLVLASSDNTSHLQSLKQLMNVLMDQKNYQVILNGDKEKIINLFKEKVSL